jgi:exonuclease SbcC
VIPERIQLAGFLSYRAEQSLSFGGSPIWLLSGANGSGKSAVFDAVTYALFGLHRGGGKDAIELINKDSNALEVVFDFRLDSSMYRIRRTLKRTKSGKATGTQQVFRFEGGDWLAVEDTNKRVDFDAWIHAHVGLSYETFTSSVLLLQGKAEKLLDSQPSGRAEVLAGIVDLERYQKLHEMANQRKLALKGQLEAISHQSNAVPEVTEAEYAEATLAIEAAEAELRAATDAIESLQKLESLARSWEEAETRLSESREKLKKAEYLLGSAVKIEQAHARLLELRSVLPAANAVVTTRTRLIESEQKTERLTRERDGAIQRQTLAEADGKTARQKRETLRLQIETHQKTLEADSARLRELSGSLKAVELAEELHARLTDIDRQLAAFEGDPADAVHRAETELEQLLEIERVVPVLLRIHDERAELKTALQRQTTAEKRLAEVRATGDASKAEHQKILDELTTARQARATADDAVAAAVALATQAGELARDFDALAGEPNCRACGQPLTPEHFADEKRRREDEARAAQTKLERLRSEQATVVAREQALQDAEAAARTATDGLREQYRDTDHDRKQASTDAARHIRTLRIAYAELPASYARRIAPVEPADWLATNYPERDELARLTRACSGLTEARRSLLSARETQQKWARQRADRESVRKSLDALRGPSKPDEVLAIRREYGELQAKELALQNALKAARANLASADGEVDRLGQEAHRASTLRTDLVGKLHAEELTREHCRDVIDREMKKLSPEWRDRAGRAGMNEYYTWKSEHDALVAEGTEATFKNLEIARGGLEALRAEIREREAAVASFPEDARQHPNQLALPIAAAKAERESRDRELQTARQCKTMFDLHRARRAELGEQYHAANAEFGRYKDLAELLGRDRLQRHLVRKAERQIVDFANGVLDRLSGGQLFLKLTGADDTAGAEKALDLECVNRATGGAPINVAFLSGSQKFRVAVGLALGIGQYASRQHRPIESVIIDEGFGCLDRAGRQTMIQELHNLRGHLSRILLVSHQEEFAEAFDNGYRFELVDNATKVTRIQR